MASVDVKPDEKKGAVMIKINFASESELQKLPSVGSKTANAIMDHRVLVGNITESTIGDIKNVKPSIDLMKSIDFEPNPDYDLETGDKPIVDTTEKMIGTVDELVSAKNKAADQKYSKTDQHVKQESGISDNIKGQGAIPKSAQKTNKKGQAAGQTMAGATMPGQTMPGQTTQGQTSQGQTMQMPQGQMQMPGQMPQGQMQMPGQMPQGQMQMPGQMPQGQAMQMPGQLPQGQTMPGQTMSGFTMPSQTMPGFTMPGFTMPSQTMSGQTMPGMTMAGQTMPGTAMAGQQAQGQGDNHQNQGGGINNQWQQQMYMNPGMMPAHQMQQAGMFSPMMNPWMPGYGMPYMMPPFYNCQPGYGMYNQWQPGYNQWQPANYQWQPGQAQGNQWQPGYMQGQQFWNQQQQGTGNQQQQQQQGDQQNAQGNQGNNQGNQGNPQGNQGPPTPPPRRRNNRHNQDNLPKGLKYDGKENWMGFKTKFNRYMQVKNWTHAEAKDYLCWCLEGKASEYYATLVTRNEDIGFLDLLTKLEKRFGGVPLPDTAQVQLMNSTQKPEESIEDWADRVVQLSVRAFPDLPEEYMYQQAVKRICHGCIDKEAGQYVVNMNLNSVELVVDKIKSYQFNHKSIYDRHKKEVREVHVYSDSSDSSDTESRSRVKVKQTRKFNYQKDNGPKDDKQLSDLTRQMGDIKDGMNALLRHLENLQSRSVSEQSKSPQRNRSASPNNGRCFHCDGPGHFARDCPQKRSENKSAKHVSFESNLNEKGSGQQA